MATKAPKAQAATKRAPAAPIAGPSPRQYRWLAPVFAALVALPAAFSALNGGIYTGNGTDMYSYQLPMRLTLAAQWATDGFPLWNPWLLGGVPTLAGWQLGLLYPPNMLAVALAPLHGTEALIWLHLAWLAAGGAVVAQIWRPGLRWWHAALIGAWLATTGPTWGHIWAGHVSLIQAWAWWPWLWAAAIRLVDRRQLADLGWAAVALALQVLAGHPQITFYCLVGLCLVLAVRVHQPVAHQQTPTGRWLERQPGLVAAVFAVAGAVSVAAVLTLPQWLATLELAPALNRALSTPLEIATAYSAPARSLWSALDPAHFGGVGAHKAEFSYHETLAFVGPAWLALAALGVWTAPRRAVLLLVVAAFAVILALGSFGGLLPVLADALPGFGSFRVPSRWLALATVILGLLAAEALAGRQHLAPASAGWSSWGPTGLAIIGLLHGLAFALTHLPATARTPTARLQWAAYDATALAKWVGPAHRLATAAPLRQTNWGGAGQLAVAGGYEPAITAQTNYFANRLAGRAVDGYAVMFQTKQLSPWLDRMAVSHFLADSQDGAAARSFAAWPIVGRTAAGGVVRGNPTPRLRWEVPLAVVVQPNAAAAVAALATAEATTVILDRPLVHTPGAQIELQVITDRPAHVALRTTGKAAAVVVLRDAWAPGWRAFVDGQVAEIAIADGMFRAVSVPVGTHTVDWRYQPLGWSWSSWPAALAWLAVIGWLWRSRRSQPS